MTTLTGQAMDGSGRDEALQPTTPRQPHQDALREIVLVMPEPENPPPR